MSSSLLSAPSTPAVGDNKTTNNKDNSGTAAVGAEIVTPTSPNTNAQLADQLKLCFTKSHRDANTGHIQLILGPMFAGKSTELLRRIKRYEIAKNKVLLIKFMHDTRYSKDCIATHDKEMVFALPSDRLAKVASIANDYDVIGIDEGQFFPDLLPFCECAANAGKVIIVSALDGTFQRKPFGHVCELIPLAESVIKLSSVCMLCQRDAAFSLRTTAETETEVIGGSDKYIAVCRKCYMANNQAPKEAQIATPKKKRSDNVVDMMQQSPIGSPQPYQQLGDTCSMKRTPEFSPKKVRFINHHVLSFPAF